MKISTILEAASSLTEMTSAAKDLKKKYRRHVNFKTGKEKVGKEGIPSWEEVWSDIESSDYVQEYPVFGTEYQDKEDFEEETGKNADENEEEFSSWIIDKMIKPEQKERYDELIYEIENQLNGSDCWRSIVLPLSIDPAKHMDLGVYWSTKEEGADTYWGSLKNKSQIVTYKAKVDIDNVYLSQMVHARMNPSIGEMESEVTFIKGAKIWVYEVETEKEIIKINDWRHT